jgi:hypothetical protein
VLAGGLSHGLFCAFKRRGRPSFVNLIRPFGRVGQDGHMLGAHFYESAANGNELVILPLPVDDKFTIGQRRDERGVVGEDPQLALDPGGHDHIHIVLKDGAFSGNNLTP